MFEMCYSRRGAKKINGYCLEATIEVNGTDFAEPGWRAPFDIQPGYLRFCKRREVDRTCKRVAGSGSDTFSGNTFREIEGYKLADSVAPGYGATSGCEG